MSAKKETPKVSPYTFDTIFEKDIALSGLFVACALAIKRALTHESTPSLSVRFANNHSPLGVREIEDICNKADQAKTSGRDLKISPPA